MKKSKKAARSLSVTSTIDTVGLESRLSDVLVSTGIVEVVRSESNSKQITLKCRVHDEKTWMPIITFVLQEEERNEKWEAHICQHYFLHKGKLVYTWSLTFGSNDLYSSVEDLCRIISTMAQSIKIFASQKVQVAVPPPVRGGNGSGQKSPTLRRVRDDLIPGAGIDSAMKGDEVIEVPLVGVTENRNQPEAPVGTMGRKSKGAHLIGNKRNQYQ